MYISFKLFHGSHAFIRVQEIICLFSCFWVLSWKDDDDDDDDDNDDAVDDEERQIYALLMKSDSHEVTVYLFTLTAKSRFASFCFIKLKCNLNLKQFSLIIWVE